MKTWLMHLLNVLLPCLPETRLYRLRASLWGAAGVLIHPTCKLVSSVHIRGDFELSIGEHTYIGHDVLIAGGVAPIQIGAFVDIAPRVSIINGSHEFGHESNSVRAAGRGIGAPINIGDGAWIGAGSILVGGCNIGRRAVIGAGSVVTGEIPDDTIAFGVPCRPVRRWDRDRRSWQAT